MSKETEHFIKKIEIKNYKLFKDFKAEGFGRVNLIGGKNNVGKTAFMEACYLSSDKEKNLEHILRTRYAIDILGDLWKDIGKQYVENYIKEKSKDYKNSKIITNLKDKQINMHFKSINKTTKYHFNTLYDLIIKSELEDKLDKYINKFDTSIEKFRIINNQPFCKKNNNFYNLNEFGDGLNKYISLVVILLSQTNQIIFIDEIENGIHYTNFDKLWEIILTISKEQNIQVFATTHSKECIDSFARVAKKLEDKEITYTQLKRMVDNSIKAGVYDSDTLINAIEQEHEVRGW